VGYIWQVVGLSEAALSQARAGDTLGGRGGSGDGSGSSSGLATGGVAPVWAELDGNNQLQARYLSKDALDAVFARLAVGSSGGVTWNLTDRLGSVRGVMNNSGQLVNSLSYDAFGVSSVTAPGGQTVSVMRVISMMQPRVCIMSALAGTILPRAAG
jgi:hypothetical protein